MHFKQVLPLAVTVNRPYTFIIDGVEDLDETKIAFHYFDIVQDDCICINVQL